MCTATSSFCCRPPHASQAALSCKINSQPANQQQAPRSPPQAAPSLSAPLVAPCAARIAAARSSSSLMCCLRRSYLR